MHFAWTILKKGKREKITIHYIYTCARRARRKRIKTFYKHAGLGGGGSVSIVAASKQGHCFTHSSGSISPLWFRSGLRSYKPQNVLWYFLKSFCECFATVNTKRNAIFHLFFDIVQTSFKWPLNVSQIIRNIYLCINLRRHVCLKNGETYPPSFIPGYSGGISFANSSGISTSP